MKRCAERGQYLPFFALFALTFMGMLAFVVDIGYLRYQQRLEQSAADSAAVAGAIRLNYPASSGSTIAADVATAAKAASKANTFEDGVSNVTVSVNTPPLNSTSTPGYNNNASAVEVTITKLQPVFFSAIYGTTGQNVSAHAIAITKRAAPGCIYQLDPAGGLNMTSGTIDAVNCGVDLNGAAAKGTITASSLSYTGVAPGANLTAPLVATASLPFSDPCPLIPGCYYLKNTPVPSGTYPTAPSNTTISAGNYNNCCLGDTLSAGIYYLTGTFTGPFTGTGVTIVNVGGSDLRINGGGSGFMDISAPTTGPTAGVAYYQAASISNSYLANGNPGFWRGLFYAPKMTYATNGKPDEFSFLDIGSISITGNKTLLVDPSISSVGIQTADTVPTVNLAE